MGAALTLAAGLGSLRRRLPFRVDLVGNGLSGATPAGFALVRSSMIRCKIVTPIGGILLQMRDAFICISPILRMLHVRVVRRHIVAATPA